MAECRSYSTTRSELCPERRNRIQSGVMLAEYSHSVVLMPAGGFVRTCVLTSYILMSDWPRLTCW